MNAELLALRDECIVVAGILCQIEAGESHGKFLMQAIGRLVVRAGTTHREIGKLHRAEGNEGFDGGRPRVALLEHLQADSPPRGKTDARMPAAVAADSGLLAAAERARDDVAELLRLLGQRARARTPVARSAPDRASKPKQKPVREPAHAETAALKAGARRMLQVLAEFDPLTLTRHQVGFLAGVKSTTGTFSNYWGELKSRGLLRDDGAGRYGITKAGAAVAGPPLPALHTYQGRAEVFNKRLKGGARRMLQEVMKAGRHGLTREALGVAAGISASTGTFSNYMGHLRNNDLVRADRNGPVSVHPWLLHGTV